MAKERQSNIEACRLASILLVMLVHTTYQSIGDNMSLGALVLEAFSIVGVNVFILITGYFSTTPKKGSLINLAFICFFWMFVKIVCRFEFGEPLKYKYLFFITSSNWFMASYIGLLFLAPILNIFSNSVSKRTLLSVGGALLTVEMWFGWLPPTPSVGFGTERGCSVLSFAILYLLARAIRLYGLPIWFRRYSMIIYMFCSLTLGFIAFAGITFGYDIQGLCFSYINPVVVLSSIAFLSFFENLKISSKFINHIAKSTLAVLLGHSAIFFIYTKQFKYIYDNYSGIQVVGYWALAIAIVFCASIAIDQLRLLLYKPIESFMKKHIKQNELFELHPING